MRTLIFLLAAALLGMLLSGCTVIGFAVGARIDKENARSNRVSWNEARAVSKGRAVAVTLTSGDTLYGRFTGLRALPADSYRFLYDSLRSLQDSALPRLGEDISVVPDSGHCTAACFADSMRKRLWFAAQVRIPFLIFRCPRYPDCGSITDDRTIYRGCAPSPHPARCPSGMNLSCAPTGKRSTFPFRIFGRFASGRA